MAALVVAFTASYGCEDECHANVVYFALVCLSTPPAVAGVLLLRPGMIRGVASLGVGLVAAAAVAGAIWLTFEIL
jgi:hypothetical protein